MPIDPTEHDARELLARAAATIDVAERVPLALTGLPEPAPRRRPLLVAVAAAVVLVVGGGWVVAMQMGSGGGRPAPADGPVVEHEHFYGSDQMPALIGYTAAEARAELKGLGYDVEVERDNSTCAPDGTVVLTAPGAGTTLTPGSKVRLSVTDSHVLTYGLRVTKCRVEQKDVWDLVRFARGLSGPPTFANAVTLDVHGGEPRTISSAQAADPRAWRVCDPGACHSALEALAEMITRPWTYDMPGWRYDSRYLRVMPAGGAPRTCGAGGSPGRDVDLVLFMVPPDSDVSTEGYCAPAPVIGIRFDGGAISEVSLLSTSTLDADGDITEPELDASMERLSAAQQFVSWARGHGPAPDFADRVRHFNGGLAPRWNDDPERRDGWSGCSGLGFPDCAIDPVGAIARYDGKVVAAPGRSTCPVDRTVPEPYASASDLVRLSVPEPASCGSAWVVELWIDARGRIYAVSQVGTATAQ